MTNRGWLGICLVAAACGGGGGELGAPQNLSATYVETPYGVDVAWTAPAKGSADGYLIARADNANAVEPALTNGTVYSLGDDLGGGWIVVFAGDGTAINDAAAMPDTTSQYMAWAYDGDKFSPAAIVGVEVLLPAQITSLSVSNLAGTPVVTAGAQPTHFALAGTATYDAVADILTVSVTVTNHFPRVVFNAKATTTSVGQGTATSDGTFKGFPTAYFGPAALAIAGSETRDIVISGVDGTVDPLVIDLQLYENPTATSGGAWNDPMLYFTDLSGGRFNNASAFGGDFLHTAGYRNGEGHHTSGVFSLDGRYFFSSHRNTPVVMKLDMTTMAGSQSAALSNTDNGIGYSNGVVLSPDGKFVYAMVVQGAHRYGNNSDYDPDDATPSIDLVKLNSGDLTEVARFTLILNPTEVTKANAAAITPDGSTLVALTSQGTGLVHFIDLTTFALIESVDVTEVSDLPRGIAVSYDGTKAAVKFNDDGPEDGSALLFDVASRTYTVLLPDGAGAFARSGTGIWFDRIGRIFVGALDSGAAEAGLSVYTPTSDSWTHKNNAGSIANLQFSEDESLIYVLDTGNGGLQALSADDLEPVMLDGNPSSDCEGTSGSHAQARSPF